MPQFFKFLTVGLLGLIVDYVVFFSLVSTLDSLVLTRLLAFWCAAFATWLGNRWLTFNCSGQSGAVGQCIKHLAFVHLSGALNMLVFCSTNEVLPMQMSFLAGIAVGTMSNFVFAKYVVFTDNKVAKINENEFALETKTPS